MFLLGAAKCGTTSLAACLGQHPEIQVARSKEPTFFSRHFNIIRNPLDYLEQFHSEKGAKVRIDASHANFSDLEVAPAIHLLFPSAKFILIFRNPALRSYALFHHMRRHGYEQLPTFEAALLAEDERFHDESFRFTAKENYWNQLYLRSSCYDFQLMNYLQFFPRNRFFIISMAELVGEPQKWIKLILDFLEVDLDYNLCLPSLNQASYEPLDDKLKRRLESEFADNLDRLEMLVGRQMDLLNL